VEGLFAGRNGVAGGDGGGGGDRGGAGGLVGIAAIPNVLLCEVFSGTVIDAVNDYTSRLLVNAKNYPM
jgi:hypothetical protein